MRFLLHSSLRPTLLTSTRTHTRRFASASALPDGLYDVVIVGGGPAGLCLSTALRSSYITSHLKIALIEAFPLASSRTWSGTPGTFSNRVSSLTPSSVAFLERIGAWKHVDQGRVQRYDGMQVWDGVSGAKISFGEGGETIAYMTENVNLVHGLLSRLEEMGGVDVIDGRKVQGIEYGKDDGKLDLRTWPVVKLEGGRELTARLLVGADGQNSPVRKFAEIESRGWDYGRVGVVATLKLEEGASQRRKAAYQRFLPSGPIAMLPLPGDYGTLVWSTTPSTASLLKSLSPPDLSSLINAGFRLSTADLSYLTSQPLPSDTSMSDEVSWRETITRPSGAHLPPRVVDVQEGSVAAFPLKLRHADSYIAERVALAGDAAHTTHPLAGQGLNLGVGDAESLVKAVEVAVKNGQDVGSVLSLEAYNSERYFNNHLMLGVVDKLHMLYGSESAPVVGLRSLGLNAVNSLGFVKNFLMRQASGGKTGI